MGQKNRTSSFAAQFCAFVPSHLPFMQMNDQHFQYNTALEPEMDPCVKVTTEFNHKPCMPYHSDAGI